jgi:hypothetical protein
MTKEQLAKLIAEGLSIRQIAQRANTSYTNARYWLKQHGFKTNCRAGRKPKELSRLRKCACGETDPSKFYGNKFWLCAKCLYRKKEQGEVSMGAGTTWWRVWHLWFQ